MSRIVADSIVSPLGMTSEQTLDALVRGESALRLYRKETLAVGEDYVASLITEEQLREMRRWLATAPPYASFTEDELSCLSRFEVKTAFSVISALDGLNGPKLEETLFIISTTKGEVEENIPLGSSADRISRRLGFGLPPVVVSNACVSGLSAIIAVDRLMGAGFCKRAVVCGTDDVGRFVVAGFQSLKALSAERCRPFDIDRIGLNLGEAVATLVLEPNNDTEGWHFVDGRIKNDAYHVSAPSQEAAGACLCLQPLVQQVGNIEELAVVNLHGTATVFNDQMESIAMAKSGLSAVPHNGLKGTLGHTLGAAGLVESILTIHATDRGLVLPTWGYAERGTSAALNLTEKSRYTQKHAFLKTLAGFGGVNAAALFSKEPGPSASVPATSVRSLAEVEIGPDVLRINGQIVEVKTLTGKSFLTTLYKRFVDDYPKFYKMDSLSQLGFLTSELLLQEEQKMLGNGTATCAPRFTKRNDRAVALFNTHSSISADRDFLQSLGLAGETTRFFPSPSVFVYTLPNIVTGEIAIRNLYQGETQFYVVPIATSQVEGALLQTTFADPSTLSAIVGEVEYISEANFHCLLHLYTRQ